MANSTVLTIKSKPIAVISILGASRMTERKRREIAMWLRNHANRITREGTNYSDRFTGRFYDR